MTMIRQTTKVKRDGTVEVQNPALTPGDEVEVIVLLPNKEKVPAAEPYGFLKILEEARLTGAPDWSSKLDDYLYHGKTNPGSDALPG